MKHESKPKYCEFSFFGHIDPLKYRETKFREIKTGKYREVNI